MTGSELGDKAFDFPLLMTMMKDDKSEYKNTKEDSDAIVLIQMMKYSGVDVVFDVKHGIPSIQNLAEVACKEGNLELLKKIVEYDPKYYFECHKLMCHAKDSIIADYIHNLIKLHYSDDEGVKLWGLSPK